MEGDDAIAARFPREWARANDPNRRNGSKARNNLRRRYRLTIAHDEFVAANPSANCGNCAHSKCAPGLGIQGLACLLDSDFHGYQIVKSGDVCVRWEGSKP